MNVNQLIAYAQLHCDDYANI